MKQAAKAIATLAGLPRNGDLGIAGVRRLTPAYSLFRFIPQRQRITDAASLAVLASGPI
jgi:hypothetical protein